MQRRKAGLPDWLRLSWTPPAPYSFPVFLGDPETPEGSHFLSTHPCLMWSGSPSPNWWKWERGPQYWPALPTPLLWPLPLPCILLPQHLRCFHFAPIPRGLWSGPRLTAAFTESFPHFPTYMGVCGKSGGGGHEHYVPCGWRLLESEDPTGQFVRASPARKLQWPSFPHLCSPHHFSSPHLSDL